MAKKSKCFADGGDVQEYEGDDVSALVTAKQRMAERDAEYAAKRAADAESEAPAPARKAPARAKPKVAVRPSKPVPPLPEDAPRRPSMMAPAVQEAADAVRSGAAAMGRGMSMGDVQGRGLRGLGGGTQVPGMKKGGAVKKMTRGGGIAQRGVGRGRMV